VERCIALAQFSETPGAITRTFLSPPMRDAHRLMGQWMSELDMESAVDGAGNLRGVLRGRDASKRLVIGSHLDTVPNAGAYDGILGVVLGCALVEALGDWRPSFDVEVVGFSEEEGVRFGVPFIGSRAFVGSWTPEAMRTADRQGITVRQAIQDYGLDPDGIDAAHYSRCGARMLGYLEFHIEQGPVLESLNLPLGVVDAIAGQSRWRVSFEGHANHAGTTPMSLRKDSLAGAAEWIVGVERCAHAVPSLVATVGRLQVSPGAGNVVPGLAEASLDVRHAEDAVRLETVRALLDAGQCLATQRGLEFRAEQLLDQPAVPCDPRFRDVLGRAVRRAGYVEHRMVSGAGHDAMIVAPHMPTAMLFLRSPGGVSHHPDEAVLVGDVAAALESGATFLRELEKEL
jgi:allantoate deiminase